MLVYKNKLIANRVYKNPNTGTQFVFSHLSSKYSDKGECIVDNKGAVHIADYVLPPKYKHPETAEYYRPLSDGVTPDMYFRWVEIEYSDKTTGIQLQYKSFTNTWMNSKEEKPEQFVEENLIEIK